MDFDDINLWSMHFPHLRSLTLGFWPDEFPPGERDFLGFIITHGNTIEVLDLEYDGCDDDAFMFHESSGERLTTCSFPRLHSLRGNSLTLWSLVHARLDCLRMTLCRLAIGPGALQNVFEAISSPKISSGPPVDRLVRRKRAERCRRDHFSMCESLSVGGGLERDAPWWV
jgi:hypothetical protein